MQAFNKRFLIEKLDGSIVELRALSVHKTMEYQETYRLMAQELSDEKYKALNISEAYLTEAKFKYYVDSLFKLFNADISAADVSSEMLYSLLFPHETEEGGYETIGILTKFVIGTPKDKNTTVTKDEADQYAEALSQLLVVFKNYEQATGMLEQLTPQDLVTVLEAYAEKIKTPDQKVADKLKGEADKLKEKWSRSNDKLRAKVTKVEEMSQSEINRILNNAGKS